MSWPPPADAHDGPGEHPDARDREVDVPPPAGSPHELPPPSGTPAAVPPPGGSLPGGGPPVDLPPPEGPAHDLPPPEAVGTGEWRQLDPRMLLLNPVRTVLSLAVPLLVAVFGFGGGGQDGWALRFAGVAAMLAVLFGLVPWFTTRYRFTGTQLQVRRGLVSRTVLTARLDRVRSVDLESPLLHRLLGLAKVKVGTGVDDTRIELDSLGREQAAELREYLLRLRGERSAEGSPASSAAAVPGQHAEHGAGAGPREPAEPAGEEQLLAAIDWSWLRYAPFSLSSLVIVAGALGLASQVFNDVEIDVTAVEQAWEWVAAQAVAVLVGAVMLALAIGWVVLSTLNYVVVWWNLRLVREPGGTLRLTRGLVTTTSITIEEARVRGVQMTEPLLLRTVRGALLSTLATGVGSGGTTRVLPPCPKEVTVRVGHDVLGSDDALTLATRRHGPAALRRLHVRAQLDAVFLVALAAGAVWWLDLSWWLLAALVPVVVVAHAVLGQLTYRNLGHALTDTHLVSTSGTLQRTRVVLERAGIIGWNVDQSFFQRRRGLATLVATTAAGPEKVAVENVPVPWAVALATQVNPESLGQFQAPAPASPRH